MYHGKQDGSREANLIRIFLVTPTLHYRLAFIRLTIGRGGDSCPRVREFKSQNQILFAHLFVEILTLFKKLVE